jgi:hypothetical protein
MFLFVERKGIEALIWKDMKAYISWVSGCPLSESVKGRRVGE